MSYDHQIADEVRERAAPLLDSLEFQLTQLLRYGPDEAQQIVSACQDALEEIARQLHGAEEAASAHAG